MQAENAFVAEGFYPEDERKWRVRNEIDSNQVFKMAPGPDVMPNAGNKKKYHKSYFLHYKMVRPQLGPTTPRIDYIP